MGHGTRPTLWPEPERLIMNDLEAVEPVARHGAITSLRQLLCDRLSTTASIRERHGKDASYHPCVPPDAVAFAQSTEEVSEISRFVRNTRYR
jgi:FAD/FMN-containing dehydrogenase